MTAALTEPLAATELGLAAIFEADFDTVSFGLDALGGGEDETAGVGALATTIASDWFAPSPFASVTPMVKMVSPEVVGIPLIVPLEPRVSPGGRALPFSSDQLTGFVPPLSLRLVE